MSRRITIEVDGMVAQVQLGPDGDPNDPKFIEAVSHLVRATVRHFEIMDEIEGDPDPDETAVQRAVRKARGGPPPPRPPDCF